MSTLKSHWKSQKIYLASRINEKCIILQSEYRLGIDAIEGIFDSQTILQKLIEVQKHVLHTKAVNWVTIAKLKNV